MAGQFWPEWWQWKLELSPHLFKRMIDRRFNELELRAMMEDAQGFRTAADPSRFVVETRHEGRAWEIVVEPDPEGELLVVITAYPCN